MQCVCSIPSTGIIISNQIKKIHPLLIPQIQFAAVFQLRVSMCYEIRAREKERERDANVVNNGKYVLKVKHTILRLWAKKKQQQHGIVIAIRIH